MTCKRFVLIALLLIASLPASSAMSSDQGALTMTLHGGNRGAVAFPHQLHQQTTQDCTTCHKLFPREEGAIGNEQESGRLKKKQVMNKLCIKCHRANKKAGNSTGPIRCADCHAR